MNLTPIVVALAAPLAPPEIAEVAWHDARTLTLEGKAWEDTAAPYDRLPARAEEMVRAPIWSLSRDSAGLLVRFVSDATTISARWTLNSADLAMPHMPATGVSGLDLYARTPDGWRWVGATKPGAQENTATIANGLAPGSREYLLYLPLYNGVRSLEVGVPAGAKIEPGPPRPEERARPLVFYGTSITQGGCASRPGAVHTALLGRWLDRAVVNLGFSGNGELDIELAALMGEIEACAYVVDCLPNLNATEVEARIEPFVEKLREARPATPILLVEDRSFANAPLLEARRRHHEASRTALRRGYEALRARGIRGLHYLEGKDLIGHDGEGTVDGSHPTDLGFFRQAEVFRPVLEGILAAGG